MKLFTWFVVEGYDLLKESYRFWKVIKFYIWHSGSDLEKKYYEMLEEEDKILLKKHFDDVCTRKVI